MSAFEELNLSEVPGLGPVRRQALADAGVQDLRGLLAMKVEDLAAVRGVGIWQARKIREHLRQRGLLGDGDAGGAPAAANADERDSQARRGGRVRTPAAETAEEPAPKRTSPKRSAGKRAAAEAAAAAEPAGARANGGRKRRERAAETGAEPATGVPPATRVDANVAANLSDSGAAQGLRAQRERLPETAVALMDAIRAAAVSRRLTRQLTLLLIVAGEFTVEGRDVPPEQMERAHEALEGVDRELSRAMERQRFERGDQQDLADRIRKRRKDLERLLERETTDS